ncbi:glycosyltransferase [Nitrososphaeria virus YSH_922147]|uniref:Glycosyltransferase n=1 Tax=Nitrososphaeria virus YSH_922147 TaxID=3071323 RepID=A0A976YF77_9CAUD|nr:glycosyltransferase [Yangshan Harbor Nitrososphaeria virus]UVF62439.1 glycosyltransferase [Nitrososphaeria virus YSH_922147]
MGVKFSNTYTLTDSQRKKAETMGITEAEMIRILARANELECPDVSVIIPVYNGEKYIKECLESVKKQTFQNYEIIVVDDGSTDRTLDILTKIDDITVLIKPNGGTGSALNTGIRNAKGSWIKWLSADDVMYDDCLEIMVRHAQTTPLNNNVIFYSHYDIIDEHGKVFANFREPDHDTSQLWNFFFGNGSTSLIHRDVFEKIGGFAEIKHSEDYEFWLRATSKGVKMILVPEYTVKYRRHPDQLTNKIGGSLDTEIKNSVRNGKPFVFPSISKREHRGS